MRGAKRAKANAEMGVCLYPSGSAKEQPILSQILHACLCKQAKFGCPYIA